MFIFQFFNEKEKIFFVEKTIDGKPIAILFDNNTEYEKYRSVKEKMEKTYKEATSSTENYVEKMSAYWDIRDKEYLPLRNREFFVEESKGELKTNSSYTEGQLKNMGVKLTNISFADKYYVLSDNMGNAKAFNSKAEAENVLKQPIPSGKNYAEQRDKMYKSIENVQIVHLNVPLGLKFEDHPKTDQIYTYQELSKKNIGVAPISNTKKQETLKN